MTFQQDGFNNLFNLSQQATPNVIRLVAIFANFPENNSIQRQQIAEYENRDLERKVVTFDVLRDFQAKTTTLAPRLFNISSLTEETFNTIIIVDNGTITTGISEQLYIEVDNWVGNTATFVDSTIVVPERAGFSNPASPYDFGIATGSAVGSVTLNTNIGNPSLLIPSGRTIYGTFRYPNTVTIPAQGTARIQLGKIIYNFVI